MFRFLTRGKSRRRTAARGPNSQRNARLSVERLETRDCPSSLAVYLFASVRPDHIAHVYGGVLGNHSSPTTVTLSGAVNGEAQVNGSGSFTFETNDATLGIIDATAVDAYGDSGRNSTLLTVSPPVIVASGVTYNHQRNVTITGQIQDIDSGLPVVLGGVVSATVYTDGGGNFTYTGDANGLGTVTINVTDLWGQGAFPGVVNLISQKPAISNLAAQWQSSNIYTITGHVADEDPNGLTVTFSGLSALTDKSCLVDDRGNFSMTIYIPDSQQGFFYADVTDWWGLAADEATGEVFGN